MKEDDMDEMMRKAAENYEVDAAMAADWHAVYKAVHESEDSPVEEKKKKRRFAFWWLLLIPLGWIANTEYNKFNDARAKPVNSLQAAASKKDNADQSVSLSPKTDVKSNDIKNDNTVSEENTTKETKQAAQFSLKHFTANTNNVKPTNSNRNLNNNDDNNTVLSTQQPGNNNRTTNNDSLSQQPIIVETGDTKKPKINADIAYLKPTIDSQTSQQKNPPVSLNGSINQIDTTTHNKNNIAAKKSSTQKEKINTHYFYAGLIAGADLSFIKYQQAEPLGYNVGLLAGYKFGKRLSVESGFYLAKKNYYTAGEYFDKSNLHYFNDKKIINVNGYCKMFEIPLNIKYDISTRKKHTFFAAVGLSSYLMNKEFYNFKYIDSAGWQHSGSAPYYHTTQDWFSIFNLSAGYELKTGNKTNLRIEPYFKTTLNGVGTGNLSISSVGINAGIVRQIP